MNSLTAKTVLKAERNQQQINVRIKQAERQSGATSGRKPRNAPTAPPEIGHDFAVSPLYGVYRKFHNCVDLRTLVGGIVAARYTTVGADKGQSYLACARPCCPYAHCVRRGPIFEFRLGLFSSLSTTSRCRFGGTVQ